MVAKIATKMVKNANRFSIDILQWIHPFYNRRGGGVGGRREIVVVMARREEGSDHVIVSRLSFELRASLNLVFISLRRTILT